MKLTQQIPMSDIGQTRSQERYLRTGQPNQYRVRGQRGNWWIESTDSNNVWVDAGSGRYAVKGEAITGAHNLASLSGGALVK